MEQLDIIQKRIEPELKEMNDVIRKTLYTPNELMNRVVNNYLKGKGKQIRPMLVILSAKMFGEVSDDVIYAGAALEMLHNASLIHDDVIDETSLRRGRNTINCDWGNQIAVLTGDFFVSNALAAGIKTGHISIVSALSDLGKELSIGEIDQICNAREHHFDEDKYIDMIRKKQLRYSLTASEWVRMLSMQLLIITMLWCVMPSCWVFASKLKTIYSTITMSVKSENRQATTCAKARFLSRLSMLSTMQQMAEASR
jgi:geranylgeranyl pyrophosphate synthase